MLHVSGFRLIVENKQPNKIINLEQAITPNLKSFIRTMNKDMGQSPKTAEPEKKSAPPIDLPIIDSGQKPSFSFKAPQSVSNLSRPPLPARPSIPLKKEFSRPVEKKEIEKKKLEIEPELSSEKSSLKYVWLSLIIILIIGGLGGFFYWWNYSRVAPITSHFECQDNQCLIIEGTGEDQCQIDQDCQPIEIPEPNVPAALIPISQAKTIELTEGEENLLLEKIKELIINQEQATSTIDHLLVKLTSSTEKKYLDLDNLLTNSNLSLPDNIRQSILASDIPGENYTLFSYNQAQGNRLGLVINVLASETLIEDLKAWEQTMINDLKPLLLKDQVPAPATLEFQDNLYQETDVRYLNFPDPDLSIDYAVVDNKLIITTSRESMYAVINALSF
ncbi:MAG: hypothetical protein ABIF84_02225 [Patescibacteria group bacterium]